MAPIGFFSRLRNLYSRESEEPLPVISVHTAALLSVFFTLVYVVPFYLSSLTKPSPTLSRDAPSVIRARIRAVTAACLVSSLAVLCLAVLKGNASLLDGLKLLGVWPVGPAEIARSFLLTAILFAGPLFERGAAEGEWKEWFRGSKVAETLSGWIGWRNYVAGPVTEEVMFRSVIVAVHLLAKVSPGRIVLVAPLYFGIAHIHHFYEFRLTHPDTPVMAALLRSLFQFGFTTVFGWYATFIFLRTGSLLAVILIHSFCNWCGLPRLWGRVEAGVTMGPPLVRGKEDSDVSTFQAGDGTLGIGWTVAYYVILVAGAAAFYYQLWPLTASPLELVSFTAKSK
ncbi:CaaX prenyl proteinase Rce1 [Paecilomyces variotii No. 5]|uniref:intramembrane prenyl-peptidase Rce1 n=1 Tax=Byssochlamys spectabilis (strain No. 5 / NBRC 109023) TaxID=1356009 RepID=V5FIT5_BYSSN|nr:CaaX prenyl proteinase Rce1 [Paecilomyces variotii No. 5]